MNKLKGFEAIRSQVTTDSITKGLSVYSAEVVASKYPHAIDGLKVVQRRILWYGRDHRELEDMVKMIAGVFELSTSGDSSIYEAILRLSQDFVCNPPLIATEGNVGAYYGGAGAAAARYLESGISAFGYDLFFKNINEGCLPMKDNKVLSSKQSDREPKYLIPKIPTALLLGNSTIGIGFKALAPMLSLDNICDLVMKYADSQVHGKEAPNFADPKVYGKYCIPSFPIANLVTNRRELLKSYAEGDFNVPIELEGQVELNGDSIVVRRIVYGEPFDNRINRLRESLKDSKSKLYDYIKTANSYSSDDANLTIPLVRGRNPFEALDMLRPILKLRGTMHPHWLYSKDGKLVELPPLDLLTAWYKARYTAISVSLKQDLARLIEQQRELEATLFYLENTKELTRIVQASETSDDIIDKVYHAFNKRKLSRSQVNVIRHVQLESLAKDGKPRILAALEKNKLNQKETLEKASRIDQLIYNEAQRIKKEYSVKSPTRYADDFKGYVKFGDLGVIQFFDEEDMLNILSSKGWGGVVKTIHLYESKVGDKYIIQHGQVKPLRYQSREITCEDIAICPPNRTSLTLVINKEGYTSVVEDDYLQSSYKGYQIYPITRKFFAIHKNGAVTEENYTNFVIKKSVGRGTKTDIVYPILDTIQDAVVFHMHNDDKNSLRVDRILYDRTLGKLVVPPGEMHILGVYPLKYNKDIYLNIPHECTRGISIEHLVVRGDLHRIFSNGGNSQLINLNKSRDGGAKITRNSVVKSLYTLDLGE